MRRILYNNIKTNMDWLHRDHWRNSDPTPILAMFANVRQSYRAGRAHVVCYLGHHGLRYWLPKNKYQTFPSDADI